MTPLDSTTATIDTDRRVEPASILLMALRAATDMQRGISTGSSRTAERGSRNFRRISCSSCNSRNRGDLAMMTCGNADPVYHSSRDCLYRLEDESIRTR